MKFTNKKNVKLYKGAVFYFTKEASLVKFTGDKDLHSKYFKYIEHGCLAVENGKVKEAGEYNELIKKYVSADVKDYTGCIITPGFIDTHLHVTQSGIVGAYGEKLLEWLNNYVFPGEAVYHDPAKAKVDIKFFLDQLIKNGTTTACGYGPLTYEAANILFDELNDRNMRFITGNTMQDINSPDYLSLTAPKNIETAEKMIKKWQHRKGRQHYALSPRFAFACTEELMKATAELKKQYPELYIQTHLDENKNEIKGIKKLFPWSKNYLDVYNRMGLATDKTIYGHCIYLTDDERKLMRDTKGIVSSCPISNNFLGSGLFDFKKMLEYTDRITLGTDWGAGNSLSMMNVMDAFYKVELLQNFKVYTMSKWFMCTLGPAKSLGLDKYIGSFEPDMEADFVVIDPSVDDMVKYRLDMVDDIYEMLFILQTLGGGNIIKDTYIYGKCMTP